MCESQARIDPRSGQLQTRPIRRTPWRLAICALAANLLVLLFILARHHFDPSVFIVAGDRFVDARITPTPIIVRSHSAGYDGQFYYALANHPFTNFPVTAGVAFDHPIWRAQRILYPLLSHLLAFAQPVFVPAAMLVINLGALCAIAAMAVRRDKTAIPALAILLWPGILTTLTHDTTELLACALLLASLHAYLRNSLALFATLAALAVLTRETACLMLFGVMLASLYALWQRPDQGLAPARAAPIRAAPIRAAPGLYAAAALLPALIWHLWLVAAWRGATVTVPAHADLGLPFMGVATRLLHAASAMAGPTTPAKPRLLAANAFAVCLALIVYSAIMAASAWRLVRQHSPGAAIAAGWLCIMVLMVLLSAAGPWVDPTAILRAFSEAWIVGWLLISLDGTPPSWATLIPLPPLAAANALLCFMNVK